MSYLARLRRPAVRHLASIAVAIATISTACGGADENDTSPSTVAVTLPVGLVGPAEFTAALAATPDMPLINVHIPYEGHIDGTDTFIAFDSILESAELPTDKSAPIALYCRSGNMSAQATADLTEAGYTNVIDLDGGMNAWQADGNDLLDDPSAAGL